MNCSSVRDRPPALICRRQRSLIVQHLVRLVERFHVLLGAAAVGMTLMRQPLIKTLYFPVSVFARAENRIVILFDFESIQVGSALYAGDRRFSIRKANGCSLNLGFPVSSISELDRFTKTHETAPAKLLGIWLTCWYFLRSHDPDIRAR